MLFLIIGAFMALKPVKVVVPNKQPYEVMTKTIKAGDNMIYIADVCKHKAILGVASRTFVDENGVNYPLPSQNTNIKTGCAQTPVVIPTLVTYAPGKWHLKIDIQYQVNPLRVQTEHFVTEEFTIEAR